VHVSSTSFPQVITACLDPEVSTVTSLSAWASRRISGSALALAAVIVVASSGWRLAAEPQQVPAPVFRVFLKDGSSVATYGEFVRVGDQVVFSIPLGQENGLPRLQAASVPADEVDWPETDRYAASLRAERYFATRAQTDFDVLADANAEAPAGTGGRPTTSG